MMTMREVLRRERFCQRHKKFLEKSGAVQIAPCANMRLRARKEKGAKK